jgi:hypothetical protein
MASDSVSNRRIMGRIAPEKYITEAEKHRLSWAES